MAITIDDFSKIWASTSPLTPYSFSESNYKEGWNFIGGTPPSRQMWDFLQKNNDEKTQYLLNNFDNYLPLSGGTLTGDVNGVTPADSDDSTKLATTEFVDNVFLSKIISKLQEVSDLPAGTSFPSTTVLSKMISQMNVDDDVEYDFSNNDSFYICFGAKFGNIMIQAGRIYTLPQANWTTYTLPFAYKQFFRPVVSLGVTGGIANAYADGTTGIKYKASGSWNTDEPLFYICIGI